MDRTVSWAFASSLATVLSAAAFGGALAAERRAALACAAEDALTWCGLGSGALRTMLLFAGIGFLLAAGLFALTAQGARVVARAART